MAKFTNVDNLDVEFGDTALMDSDEKRARLLRAGYKILWETVATTHAYGFNDSMTISSWVPNDVIPYDHKSGGYENSIFYRDFLLVERGGSNSIYTHGGVPHPAPDDGSGDYEHEQAAFAVEVMNG